jgi:hypothetical protein
MLKLNRVKWYNKLIIGGVLLVALANPLSLVFIADGTDIAIVWLGQLVQLAFTYAVDFSPYIIGIGAVAIVLGFGASLGAKEKKTNYKLEKLKHKKTAKGGEFIGA